MKTAYVTYVANGYTLQASAETLHPPPVWVFAASIDEAIYYLSQYFASAADDDPPPSQFVEGPIDRSVVSTNPLLNQEAVIWPALPSGFIVRQSQSPAAPGRPPIEQYCLNVDAVHAALTAIFTGSPA